MNVLDVIRLAAFANQAGVSFGDAEALFSVFQTVKASGKLDLAALDKAGTLDADIAAAVHALTAAQKALGDPTQRARLISLSSSL